MKFMSEKFTLSVFIKMLGSKKNVKLQQVKQCRKWHNTCSDFHGVVDTYTKFYEPSSMAPTRFWSLCLAGLRGESRK